MSWRYLFIFPVILFSFLDRTFGSSCAALFKRPTVEITFLTPESEQAFVGEISTIDYRSPAGIDRHLTLEIDTGSKIPLQLTARVSITSYPQDSRERKRIEDHLAGPIKLIQLSTDKIQPAMIRDRVTPLMKLFSNRRPYRMYATLSKNSIVIWLWGYETYLPNPISKPLFMYFIPEIDFEPRWVSLDIEKKVIVVHSSHNQRLYFLPLSRRNRFEEAEDGWWFTSSPDSEDLSHMKGSNLFYSNNGLTPPDYLVVGSRENTNNIKARKRTPEPLQMQLLEHRLPDREIAGRIRLRHSNSSINYNELTLLYIGTLGDASFRILSAEFSNSRDSCEPIEVYFEAKGRRQPYQIGFHESSVALQILMTDKGAVEKLNPSTLEPYSGLWLLYKWDLNGPNREEVPNHVPSELVPVTPGA